MHQLIQHKNKWYIKSDTGYREVLATTDPKLINRNGNMMYKSDECDLPQPSQSFIKEYCDKGGIDEVEIECERLSTEEHTNLIDWDNVKANREEEINKIKSSFKFKVNPDNTINIKPIKESWNRGEVSNKLYECLGFFAHKHDITIDGRDISKWIEKNL